LGQLEKNEIRAEEVDTKKHRKTVKRTEREEKRSTEGQKKKHKQTEKRKT
jgi:hypothetical protein